MIRITVITETEEDVVLKIEGWLMNEAVDVLATEGNRHLRQNKRLVLDLTGVRFIDDAGIQLLQQWLERKLVLRGASPFVQALLEAYGLYMEGGDQQQKQQE